MHVLMEGTPRGIDPQNLRKELEKIPGVILAHDMHVWSITAGRPAIAMHLTTQPMPDVDSEVCGCVGVRARVRVMWAAGDGRTTPPNNASTHARALTHTVGHAPTLRANAYTHARTPQ